MADYRGGGTASRMADYWTKKRDRERVEVEAKKQKIEEDLKIGSISSKFATHVDAVEQKLKADTVGLLTLDEMREKQKKVLADRERQLAVEANDKKQLNTEAMSDARKRKKRKNRALLSFDMDEDEEEGEQEAEPEILIEKEKMKSGRKRLGKNPDVDTSFLPDHEREKEEEELREKLMQEWKDLQERVKEEEITVVYNYWDGSGHRQFLKMKKGNTIEQFLQKSLERLRNDYSDLRVVSVDQMMYIKEDLIIPQHYTFYDFIVTKARGKSGPLFDFGADDIKIIQGVSVDKEEAHAGKVCTRLWYERNKHIFPANRWEAYDPQKKWLRSSDKLGGVKVNVK